MKPYLKWLLANVISAFQSYSEDVLDAKAGVFNVCLRDNNAVVCLNKPCTDGTLFCGGKISVSKDNAVFIEDKFSGGT